MKSVCLILATVLGLEQLTPSIEYKWKYLNYTFQTPSGWEDYMKNKTYEHVIPVSVVPSSSGQVFVAMPRYYDDVPATLGTVSSKSEIPKIAPYPNWTFNMPTEREHFKSVVALELDTQDNLWVLDSGRSEDETTDTAAKLVKINLSNEDFTYYYLESLVSSSSSLSSFQVDPLSNKVYISDSSETNPAIIVYDLADSTGVRVLENAYSTAFDKSLILTFNDDSPSDNNLVEVGVSALALSCDRTTLYYAPLTSRYLFAIPTKALNASAEMQVIDLGYKWSAGNGLLIGMRGNLFISAGELNTVYRVDTIYPGITNLAYNVNSTLFNESSMIWPGTLTFSRSRDLLVLSNNYLGFLDQSLDYSQPNFYLWSLPMDDLSYLYGCDYGASSSNNSPFPLWGVSLIVFSILLVILSLYCFLKYFTAYRKRQRRRLLESRALND